MSSKTVNSASTNSEVTQHSSGYVSINGDVVGPKMVTAVRRVRQRGPYESRNVLSISVGPNGSQQYGYGIVNRCIRKGLLAVDDTHPNATPQGTGAVVITQKGMDLCSAISSE